MVFAKKGILALNLLKSAISACSFRKVSLSLLKSAVSAGNFFFQFCPLWGQAVSQIIVSPKSIHLGPLMTRIEKIEDDVF